MNKNEFLERLTHAYRLEQLADGIGTAEHHANVAAANVPVGEEETPDVAPSDMASSAFPEAYEHLTDAEQLLGDAHRSLHAAANEARKPFEVLTTTEKAQLILDLLPEEDSPLPPEQDLGETERAALEQELREVKKELDDLRGLS